MIGGMGAIAPDGAERTGPVTWSVESGLQENDSTHF
jgi:hypothetical protein